MYTDELRNTTDSIEAIAQKMGLRSIQALLATYYLVLKGDLERDSFVLIQNTAGLAPDVSAATLTQWFGALGNSGKIHTEDLDSYRSYADVAALRAFYETHSRTSSHFTRVRGNVGGEFRSILIEFIPAEDYTPAHPTVYMFIKDVHESITDTATPLWKVFQSLCDDYESIYYVDFEKDVILPYRSSAVTQQSFGWILSNSGAYWPTVTDYIRKYASQDEQSNLLQIFRREKLQERFRQKPVFVQEFHVNAERKLHTFRIKFCNLSDGDTLDKIVIALADISGEPQREQDDLPHKHVLLVIEQGTELTEILRKSFKVYSSHDYNDAVALYYHHQDEISLVISDYIELEHDRNIVLQQVCATAHEKNLPIIVTSDFAPVEDEVQYLKYGISDIISKPYYPEIIQNRIERTIHMHESSALLEHFKWDELTGLYERKSFLQYAQARVQQAPHHKYWILCSDIANFKAVDMQLGRERSNAILRELAKILIRELPGYIMGSRVSSDVFNFLLQDIDLPQLEPLLAHIRQWEKEQKISVGFGLTDLDTSLSIDQNCEHARIALKTISGVYGKHFAVYDDSFRKALLRQNRLEADAEIALQTNQFQVYYQPKRDLTTMQIGGAEALVRWKHPELGMISPGEFIPLFERSGFITRLDKYLCRRVCQDIRRWSDMGKQVVPVSVNLSRRDFEQEDLADSLLELVDQQGVPHHLIRFEITESSYTDSPENIARITRELVKNGFCLELDDFGSGYSSLVTLGALDLDCLKIDKSLVDQIQAEAGRKILLSAIRLAQSLGLKTIAEGVETAPQQQALLEMCCDYIQGFFFARPMPSQDFESFLS